MQLSENNNVTTALNQDLYDRHARVLLAYVCQHIFNAQDARDILMEVFLAALNRPDFSQMAFEHQTAWLRRVAHNKMVDRVRHMSRLTLISLDEAVELESDECGAEALSTIRYT